MTVEANSTCSQGRLSATCFSKIRRARAPAFLWRPKRLGADVVEFSASGSSLVQGRDIYRYRAEHRSHECRCGGRPSSHTRYASIVGRKIGTAVVNAGDGPHEHPTQGLLDILTIRQHRGDLEGLTVALVGDIDHSRTARSNIWGLKKLEAHVIVCGPSTLVSPRWAELGVEVAHDLDEILPRCDVLNLLRIQFERQATRPFPSVHEYALLYAMNGERMRRAKEDILISAPGPINRGVEITPDVADGQHSVILDQVTNGLAVRMAALWLVSGANGSI